MAYEIELAVVGASLAIFLATGPFFLKRCMRQRRRVHVGDVGGVGGVELQAR